MLSRLAPLHGLRRAQGVTRRHMWAHVNAVEQDPILGLVADFVKDDFPSKVNLAQGAYRTEAGAPLLLSAVREAEERIVQRGESKEYLGIEGLPAFVDGAARFALGDDCAALKEGRVASLQALSGTGALRVIGCLLKEIGNVDEVYLPSPSWANHANIFSKSLLEVKSYAYLDSLGTALDFEAMTADLRRLPPGSVVLLHAAAHNPSGVDPSPEQWLELATLFKDRGLMPLFDTAYQGFATGDAEADAFGVRAFLDAGLAPILAQSFAKNMGLYGERVGAVHVVCASKTEAENVLGNIKQVVVRPNYSSPPRHGAAVAAEVLSDAALSEKWRVELLSMSRRIIDVRAQLRDELDRIGAHPPGDSWQHIQDQIGMFAFTGLSRDQVRSMRQVEHVYLTDNGRMSLAGLASKDVPTVAASMKRAIDDVPYPARVDDAAIAA